MEKEIHEQKSDKKTKTKTVLDSITVKELPAPGFLGAINHHSTQRLQEADGAQANLRPI